MDYEKAYKDALNRAKNLKEMYPQDAAGYEEVFPELAESEDERVRKVIYKLILGMREEIFTAQDEIVTKEKSLSYLEKQKVNTEGDFGRGYDCGYQAGYAVAKNEMKPKVATATLDSEKQKEQSTEHKTYDGKALSRSYDLGYRKGVADAEKEMYDESGYTPDESRAYDHGYENGYNDGKDETKQKPAEWREEDEAMRADILDSLRRYQLSMPNYQVELQMRWLRSLCPQPKKEWSKEDERILRGIIGLVDHDQHYGVSNKDMIAWLKSLRPSWKPSEEQMEALKRASVNEYLSAEQFDILVSLYEHLKKLM